jgi:hypothetical protein
MRVAAVATVVAIYALHQDFWFWRRALPLVFGVLPVGLFYHVTYMLGSALLFWALVTWFWPSHLDDTTGDKSE